MDKRSRMIRGIISAILVLAAAAGIWFFAGNGGLQYQLRVQGKQETLNRTGVLYLNAEAPDGLFRA